MNIRRGFVTLFAGFCISASVGFACSADAESLTAQDTQSTVQSSSPTKEEMKAIERWVHDYKEWKAWSAKWRNQAEPGWFGSARERRQRPDPPAALATFCAVPLEETGELADACQLFNEWRNDDVATEVIKQQVATTRAQKETEDKSVWWRHVHLDAVWPMTQGTSGIWGVVGLHTTIDISGRVELFLTPGAMLMRVPGPTGVDQWKPATDWGLSFRLADFTIPATRRPATLHMNLARVWLLGSMEDVSGTQSNMYLAGFSLTFRKVVTH